MLMWNLYLMCLTHMILFCKMIIICKQIEGSLAYISLKTFI